MTLNNAYKIYSLLHEREHQQDKNKNDEGVRRRVAYHLPPQRDLMFVFDCNGGTKQQTDMEQKLERAVETETIQPPETAVESLTI